jgi:hypothetical protein
VLGAGIYYAIVALTHYELGIVAIVVGLLVGKAVRKGSNGRGGWRYQALAMVLTYLAIVATYAPPIFQALGEQIDQRAAAKSSTAAPGREATPAPVITVTPGADTSATASDNGHPKVAGAGTVIAALALLAGLILAAPILSAMNSPIGFIIIGIALYEAWKINRGTAFTITGPYRVVAPGAGTA